MPELAEVEIVRRNLEAWWTNGSDDTRLIDDKLLTRGSQELLLETLTSPPQQVCRRGKYLFAQFAGDRAVVFHFRMTGKIVRSPDPEPRFARLAWRASGNEWLVFKDARRLGFVEAFEPGELDAYEPLLRMGPEPHDLTPHVLAERLPAGRGLKAALLDQSVIAGVGNIAVSEVYWRLGLPPAVKVADLRTDDIERLTAALPDYFDELIALEGGEEVIYLGEQNSTSHFDVYGRDGEQCPRCATPIEVIRVAGRSSYYCPACQR
jgi:formamidopyrimidine-DNA glycosylase